MAMIFKYWDDCIDPEDLEAMWNIPEVNTEWSNAGEARDQNVHLSRDPDGQPYLTQAEMRAVADITVQRHFDSQIDPDMIFCIAELESGKQPLATQYDRKTKETSLGIMLIFPNTAQWLMRELHYQSYQVEGNPEILFRPFVNAYFGAAYLKWLSNFDQIKRSEEYVVRAYKGGAKKATHKSTLSYWQRYLSVKESLPIRRFIDDCRISLNNASTSAASSAFYSESFEDAGAVCYTYWDTRASPEDMEEMWSHPQVSREWTKCGEKRRKVRFSQDEKKRPYLSRIELKAVAEIILNKHFREKEVKATLLCAVAEVASMRFVNGVGGARAGIMGLDYSTTIWLFVELGYRAYKVDSVDDLTKPFVSMYFGAAYYLWLSQYQGIERTPQFVVQAYMMGPSNVNFQDKCPMWLKFEEALTHYQDLNKIRDRDSCSIM